jgi:hypothetical protein
MDATRKKRFILAGAFAITVGLIALALHEAGPPPRLLPRPNGYKDFVKAGLIAVLPFDANADYRTLNLEELRAAAAGNAEALKLVRTGLSRQCQAPIQDSVEYVSGQMNELGAFKQLGRALLVEAHLAELERRTNDAARICLDLIRFGHQSCRGGLMINKLVGIACEAMGRNALLPLIPNLSASNCRELLRELDALEQRKESGQEVLDTEQDWARRTFEWHFRAMVSLSSLLTKKTLNPIKPEQDRFLQKVAIRDVQTSELLISLAARAYEAEHAQPPKQVADLVPAYLRAVPHNPTNGTPLALPR